MSIRLSLSGVAIVLVCAFASHVPAASAATRTDVAGSDPVAISVAISRATHPLIAPAVVVCTDTMWRDQLTGSALAGSAGGPLLLTPATALSPQVAAEITRLAPPRVYLLAPAPALFSLAQQLQAVLPAGARLEPVDTTVPVDSARAVAGHVASSRVVPPQGAFVVGGSAWHLAMSATAPAAAGGWPVLFADAAHPAENAATLRTLGASSVFIVGDASVVSVAEEAALRDALGQTVVRRITGSGRYATSRAVNRSACASAGLDYSAPVIASASTPTDPILAGLLAARRGSLVILAGSRGVGAAAASALFAHRASTTSVAFVGTKTALPTLNRTDAMQALRARTFSTTRAMAHVKRLAAMGPRRAGSAAERKGAAYIAGQLREWGYSVSVQTVRIPGGKTSRNVIAEKQGSTSGVIVLGGHLDSHRRSPGANDNASGVGLTLELARCLADAEGLQPTVRFIAFGAEEISGPKATQHHYGSRHYVASLPIRDRRAIESMVSIDMVGRGSKFNIRNLEVAPMTTVRSLTSWGRFTKEPLYFLKDPSSDGWSDHEAFEFKGIPAAWLEWRNDPNYHTPRDSYRNVSANRVERTGRLVRGWLLNLTSAQVRALKP